MALPTFDSAAPAASAASNAGLTLAVYPTGDPTGKLLVAYITGWTDPKTGIPAAPAGWSGPFGSGGLYAFTKMGVAGDSGSTVTFAAWTPIVIDTDNSGVVCAYDNAVAFDLIKPAVAAKVSQGALGGLYAAAFPFGRTKVASTLVIAAAGFFANSPSGSGNSLIIQANGHTDTDEVNYTAGTAKAWLGINELAQASAGATVLRQLLVTKPGSSRCAIYALRDNQPPTAPNLVAPAAGATLDGTATQTFSWTFADPDPADTQSAFDLQFTLVSTGATATISKMTAATSDAVTGGYFNLGDHTWKVRTYDSDGNVSAWSASGTFTVADPPAAPTITSPTTGTTVTSPSEALDWSAVSGDQTTYEIRRVADAGGIANPTVVYWDSGETGTSSDTSYTVTFDTTPPDQPMHIRTRLTSGLWGPWADVLVHVAFTPPPTPVVTLTTYSVDAQILVTVTTPAPTGSNPAATSVDVLLSTDAGTTYIRVATGLAINVDWPYMAPASGQEYWVAAVAVADDGATALSDWVDIATIDAGDFDSDSDIIDGGGW